MANFPQTTTSQFSGDIVITNGGKAGIGTLSPTEKLDVKGNTIVRGENFTSVGETATLCLGDGAHYMRAIYGSGLRIGTYLAQDAIAIKENGGNVGVGTTNPVEKLEVNGGIKVGFTNDIHAGTIRWLADDRKLQVFNGSLWVNLH
ncbi:MAG: hypothetical protein JXA71_05360 [Chitinispirillaceae bacterium]|nr:hypothetical protein [Chitinispirillaceae bacterium]